MSITVKKAGKQHLISIKGEMSIYSAMGLWQALLDAVNKAKKAEIDLSGVSEIDSAGIQLLMMAKRIAIESGKELQLVNHSQSIVDVIEVFNLTGYFGDPVVLLSGKGD